ncbi:MAG: hypothetical protein KDK45_24275, partial [Leptospiraceae bacterium]|nr:hypothetical protein [Leptospiraceae bacterium]
SLFKENLLLIAPQARFEDYISGKELRFQYPASSPRYFLYRYTDSTLLDEKTVLENTLFLGAETLYHVLRSLYLNIPFVERHVSFFIQESSGQIQSINQKCSLKNGWNLKEFLHQFKENFSYFTLNSFYHPTEIFKVGEEFRFDIYSHNSFIICQDIQEKNFEKVCIDCDDCTLLCPVHANPRGIFDKQASSFQHTTCIECGICSFICPAHIDFSERISKIKKEKPGVG